MLLALGANELGSLFEPMPGPRAFHWAYLFLGLGEWACAPIFKPYQLPPSPCVRRACARAVSFLESDVTSMCLLRAGLVRACCRHMSCDNDDFSVFVPISSSSFSFL